MKKRFIALSLLSVALVSGSLASCSNEPEPDPTVDGITGVTITGPLSVRVNEKITLRADVVGSDNDSVTWESSNPEIATVDSSGVVTGLDVGETTIKATSTEDPNFSATYRVMVSAIYANNISLTIDLRDDITLTDGVYNVPGGATFKVNYALKPDNATRPDSIAYSFIREDGNAATASECLIEPTEDGGANVTFYSTMKGNLRVSASYKSSVSGRINTSIMLNVYDKNEENVTKLATIINNIKAKEISSLTGATHTYKSGSLTETSNFRSYKNATYKSLVSEEVVDGSTTKETINSYSTIDEKANAFYLFAYEEDKKIKEMYVNDTLYPSTISDYRNFAALPNFTVDGLPVYGFGTLLDTIAGQGEFRGNPTLGNFIARGNATYTFTDTSVKVETTFRNDYELLSSIAFDFTYNANYELSSFNYVYQEGEDENSLVTLFEDHGSNFVYGEKSDDTQKEIDINSYYIEEFNVEYVDNYSEIATGSDEGSYRYEIEKEEVVDGVQTFTLTYDHSLPVRITDFVPETASTLIDIASVSVTNEQTGSRNIGIYSDGIAVIGGPKKEDGNFIEVVETVTITTRGGATKRFKIDWKAPTLTGIKFDCPNDQDVNTSLKFDNIRIYEETPYFWLNPIPDDGNYTFGMDILSGPEDGLTLLGHEGDTDKEVPTGAYTLVANKVGTYTFNFYVIGHTDIRTETYTLVVEEGITKAEYEKNLVGKTFEYASDTMFHSITFTSNSIITLKTGVTTGDREDGGEIGGNTGDIVSIDIRYEIADGRVTILTDGEDKVNQIFNSENSYFESIYGGNIEVSDDFKSVTLQLRTRAEAVNDPYNYCYAGYTFTQAADISNLVGKTFKGEESLGSLQMHTLRITFENETSGKFVITSNATGKEAASFTFDYVANAQTGEVTLSNVTLIQSSVDGLVFKSSSMGRDNILNIVITVPTNFGYSLDYTFEVDLRVEA